MVISLIMLKVRLQRIGRKNDPSFKIVLIESKKAAKSGRALETLGSYNARMGNPIVNGEKIKYWISKGAQVSPTVWNLLISQKILSGKKINVLPKKSPPKTEVPATEAAPTEAATETPETKKEAEAPSA